MDKAKVYFTDFRVPVGRNIMQKLRALCLAAGIKKIDMDGKFVAIKMHFGELGNMAYLRPQYAKVVADLVKEQGGMPFLTDCNTLYPGSRKHALEHMDCANFNGFNTVTTGCQIIIGDGLRGTDDVEVPVKNGEYIEKAKIGRAIMDADVFISLSHFKGHEAAGFGGAIKNLAMGCASQRGKEDQHGCHVNVNQEKCVGCGTCVKICPRQAMSITDKKCHCDPTKCVGCFECMTVCPQEACEVDWATDLPAFTERLTEYAYGAVKGLQGHVMYINFVMNVTPDCDCVAWSDMPLVPDLGILASLDPVALDQACFDLVNQAPQLTDLKRDGKDIFTARWPYTHGPIQLEYGEKIGLGTREYDLKKL